MYLLRIIAFFILGASLPLHADVYRCKDASGNMAYQATPCQNQSTSGQQPMDIHFDPEKEAAAKARLQTIQNEYQQRKQDQEKQQQENSSNQKQQQSLLLQQQLVAAQQQQAAAAEREAQALSGHPYGGNLPYYSVSPSVGYTPPPAPGYRYETTPYASPPTSTGYAPYNTSTATGTAYTPMPYTGITPSSNLFHAHSIDHRAR
jgi:hypothetical protein